MDFAHFMRIEQEVRGKKHHYVVHMRDPKFAVELAPDPEAEDKIGNGVIKRVCVPNSCTGDYAKCAQFLTAAQAFFHESFSQPVSKAESRRFQT